MTETLLFRADADALMGSGHVMRAIALAEAAADKDVACRIAMKSCPGELRDRLNQAGMAIDDLPSGDELAAFLALIKDLSPGAVVIDGYKFDEKYRLAVRGQAARVLTMDDGVAAGALHADIVVNANPAASQIDYAESAAAARLLLGLEFALLRKEFLGGEVSSSQPLVSERNRILLTFGGSDPLCLAAPVTDGLLAALPGGVAVDLVLGGAHHDHDALVERAAQSDQLSLHVNSRNMASLMAGAGMAISAAGSTVLELAAMGVPAILVATADNQAQVLNAHKALDWCRGLDGRETGATEKIVDMATVLWNDNSSRQAMAEKASGLVDGNGAERVVAALLHSRVQTH